MKPYIRTLREIKYNGPNQVLISTRIPNIMTVHDKF